MKRADFGIVGGGIVGLATAYQLHAKFPGSRIVLWEKETAVSLHQTGRNSGVIHSGIYYPEGSLKAQLSQKGRAMLMEFCDQQGILYRRCGKLIVAQSEPQLKGLYDVSQGAENKGITTQNMIESELRSYAPLIAGVGALFVPDVSIVDFREVANRLATMLMDAGVGLYCSAPVRSIRREAEHVRVETEIGGWQVGAVINCAGLHSDRIQEMLGLESEYRIIPFRGQYLEVSGPVANAGLGLVYPVPDPRFPFLGVHLTPCLDGRMLAGPNAVLSLARESYDGFHGELGDLFDTLAFPGFWRLAKRHWRVASNQYLLQWSPEKFLAAVRALCPSITREQLSPGPCGIRAQVVDQSGALIHDFVLSTSPRVLSVLNAPSPAATSAFAIAEEIVQRIGTNSLVTGSC